MGLSSIYYCAQSELLFSVAHAGLIVDYLYLSSRIRWSLMQCTGMHTLHSAMQSVREEHMDDVS